jgi:hypothetical protein
MNKYIKPTKKVVIDGKVYTAVRERNYIPEPETKPRRITDEYVSPKANNPIVKTLEEIIESNLNDYFKSVELEISELKKESLTLIISGYTEKGIDMLKHANQLETEITSAKTKAKIDWMSRILIRYNDLTKQIVGREF